MKTQKFRFIGRLIYLSICIIPFSATALESLIIPAPVMVEMREVKFIFPDNSILLIADKALSFEMEYLSGILGKDYGIGFEIVCRGKEDDRKNILLMLDKGKNDAEAYTLEITENEITICSNSQAGIFCGVQTFVYRQFGVS